MASQHQKTKDQKNWFARHKIMSAVLAFCALFIVIGAIGGDPSSKDDKSTNANNDSKNLTKLNSDKKPTVPKIGEAARDGQFEFVVKGLTCGKPSVTDSSGYTSKSAQGQYCLMTLSVKNIGDKQQYFSEGDQKVLNASGQQFSPDSTATLYNSSNGDVFLSQVNPGNSVEGVLVFDIPKDQTLAMTELHDSAFSGGVKVDLK
jgi:hypothetical protein